MKRAVVKLEVLVTCEVPDHIYARDKSESAEHHMSESDIWHDYAVGAIHSECEVLHGKDEAEDWVTLYAEVVDNEMEEEVEDA